MKKNRLLLAVISAVTIYSSVASAVDFDWTDCKDEISKFCIEDKDNEKIWACLQEHDIDLSAPCDKAHSVYEEKTGKTK